MTDYQKAIEALAQHPRRNDLGWLALSGAPGVAALHGMATNDVIADVLDHESGDRR